MLMSPAALVRTRLTMWCHFARCGNAASILEISPGGQRFFNVFNAAPENERDGPGQAEAQAQAVSGPNLMESLLRSLLISVR